MASPKVTVLILSFNAKGILLQCLRSVFNSNYTNYDVLVVDNGSIDGSYEAITHTYPNMKTIRSESNLGRTGGYNLGIKYVTGDYILFLDQDTIIDKNMIAELVKVMDTDVKIGAVGPKICYYDDPKRIWSLGTSVNSITGKVTFIGIDEFDMGQFNSIFEVQQHPTAIMVRADVVKIIKGFDEDIFMVYCDSDFCLKIWEAGYRILSVPNAKMWHREKVLKSLKLSRKIGMKNPLMAYLIGRNRLIFMKKHSSSSSFFVFLIFFYPLLTFLNMSICILEFRMDLLSNYIHGITSGIRYALLGEHQSFSLINFQENLC